MPWLLVLMLVPLLAVMRPLFGTIERPKDASAVREVRYEGRRPGAPPQVTAPSAVLMDANTGTILLQRGAHVRRPMASVTKMMTAILVLEHGKLDEVVTASKHASETPYTGLYLKQGEKITLRDLLWALLLRSANDACVAAGEHVAGSEAQFVEMMNAKAQALGLKNTHFMNPHGLNAEGHYSSAYDLAQIARYGMRMPLFAEIVNCRYHRVDRSIEKKDVVVVNKNRLVFRWDQCDGIKTGYTRQAGHCLAASASQGPWRLIAVVLKSGNSWEDSRRMLQWGMRHYQSVDMARKASPVTEVRVMGGREEKVQAVLDRDLQVVVPNGARVDVTTQVTPGKVRAPVRQGDSVGKLVLRQGEKEIGQALLLAANTVEPRPLLPRPGYVVMVLIGLSTLLLLPPVARYGRKAAQGFGRRGRRLPPRV